MTFKKHSLLFSLLFFTSLTGIQAKACDFCMLGQGISPYLTSTGKGLTLDVNSTTSNKVYNHTDGLLGDGKKESWLTYSLTGFYTLTDDLNISVTVPYTEKTNIDADAPATLTNGVGDVSITGRYTFFRQHTLESTWVAGGILGVKLPTGSSDMDDTAGNPVDRHALPGTGSYDLILGGSTAYTFGGEWQITADVVYNVAGAGKWNGQDHRYGNSLNYSVKGFYNLLSQKQTPQTLFVYVGPSGESQGMEKGTQTDDGYDTNLLNRSSGGTVLFADLGIYSNLSANTILNLRFSKAFYHNMNADENFDMDPAEDYKINFSLTYLF